MTDILAKDMQIGQITRAWSTLEIKKVGNAEARTIKGTASTPTTDRMGDIVEPLGMEFKNPIPLIWQHKHAEPLGLVYLDQPTAKGVTFSAMFAEPKEPGALKSRIDDAWQAVNLGLVRGVSIGFRTLELNFMDDGGIRFVKTEVVELSLVTIPANAEATITQIKTLDDAALAATGNKSDARKLPGDSGEQQRKPEQQKGHTMPKQIAEQISAYEGQRKTAQDRMSALMTLASDDGRTLDEAEAKEYDGCDATVKSISEHVGRLQRLEEQNKVVALPVAGNGVDAARAARDPVSRVVIRNSHLPPATAFIRFCLATMAGKGNRLEAKAYAEGRKDWHSSTPEILQLFDDVPNYAMRAAVPAATTYDSTWAGPLVVAQNVTAEFAEFLRPMTIIGRIPGLRRVPFNISLPRGTGGTSAGWVGEAAPKPITSMTFDTLTLRWAKAAAISVLTEELVRFSNPAAEDVVRRDLAKGITQFLDRQFVDPAVAAVTNVSPASITNGVTPITPSGVNMAAFRADVRLLFQGLLAAGLETSSGVWIMTQQQAIALSLAQNTLGQIIYPTMNAQGGTLLGFPVVASENMPAAGGSPADGYPLIFAIADEIMLADDGQVVVDASREASLQMDSTPDSPPTAATNMLSLWQLNMLGLRAERWITWLKRRSTAVAYITNSHYAE